MKKTKHTPEQIITKLRRVEALSAEGSTIAEAAKRVGVSEQTIYRWKNQYGQMDRDELLERELFASLTEAQVLSEIWRRHYNERCSHSSLGYATPAAFAAAYHRSINEQPALVLT